VVAVIRRCRAIQLHDRRHCDGCRGTHEYPVTNHITKAGDREFDDTLYFMVIES
jgi:hypothetical protein